MCIRDRLYYAAFEGQRSAARALYELGARGTLMARKAAERGRVSEHVSHTCKQMQYLIFCGMMCEMAGFRATIASHFDAVIGAPAAAALAAATRLTAARRQKR